MPWRFCLEINVAKMVWDGNDALKPHLWVIAELKHDKKNARKHSADSVKVKAESLKKFGQQKPIIILKDGTIIAGNGLTMAAKELGWDYIAALVFKDKKMAQAFALADNRMAEISEWNPAALQTGLAELQAEGFDMKSLGWDDSQLQDILSADNSKGHEDQQGKLKIKVTVTCPKCKHNFPRR